MRLTPRLFASIGWMTVLFSGSSSAEAAKLTLNVITEIVSMDLTGTSPIPLATDPANVLGDSINGYGFVDTYVTATESTTESSTVSTSIVVDNGDPLNQLITIDSSLALFLDLMFEDVDARSGRDFATGLGSPFARAADPLNPITADIHSQILISFPGTLDGLTITDLGTVSTGSTYVVPLGVDVNGNAELDVMKLSAHDFEFVMDDILFTDIEISEADLLSFLLGNDVTIDLEQSLAITSSSLTFNGQVLDAISDPPFTLGLSGPTGVGAPAVPEPSTFALFGIGSIVLAGCVRRRRRPAA